jgi:hypothetical protein
MGPPPPPPQAKGWSQKNKNNKILLKISFCNPKFFLKKNYPQIQYSNSAPNLLRPLSLKTLGLLVASQNIKDPCIHDTSSLLEEKKDS